MEKIEKIEESTKWLTPVQVAKIIKSKGISTKLVPNTVINRIKQKKLKGAKVIGKWYVDRDSLQDFIKDL